MKQMTSSAAKQHFGELLSAAALEPVAIERHQKIRAIVCSPEVFARRSNADTALAERRAARAAQLLVDKNRLIRHQRLAVRLLLASGAEQKAMLGSARQEVARWEHEHLCSQDYIAAWKRLLDLPVKELADAMSREDLEWGAALRQNSPWHGLVA